jgi:hypothetical protein
MLLTISRKAPVPLRAERLAVFWNEICVNMQGNAKTIEVTCTDVPQLLLKTRAAGGSGSLLHSFNSYAHKRRERFGP